MASFGNRGGASSPSPAIDSRHDPFVVAASPPSAGRHRLSTFDSQIFSLSPNASPTQAKRALEAHLAETDRRMEEAGKLGTALLQQRKELSQRLMEVEKQQAEGELSDDLRQRLAEIEKDYNDVARESARAFLPKQRIPSNEAAAGSPFAPESKGGRRSVSPSKFEDQATASPTKFSVPNRKVRNQPANRIHDIEFAAEISTSLIAQVRNLQGLLAEKEEELKEIRVEKSKLEYEAEGFQQRVKTLDESEHRYKDENWSLETQVHDLLAKEREAEDRYKKLQQTLTVLQAEKNSTQKELDEVKLNHSKLSEEYAAVVKHHDIELGSAKRNIVIADTERAALRKRIDELTGQNQELAKAVSASQRARVVERESILGMNQEDSESAQDKTTPEHSPPPSPVKGTPRHSLLESETLKTSLGHAHRTIQGLRSNVHREKTEKLELRRMLQEARDELEKLRNEPPPPPKRTRKAEVKEQRKPLRGLLGGLRTVRSEVFSEDSNWEDQPDSTSPAHSTLASRSSKFESVAEEPYEQFETANETSDAAFETAHEPATETDDFHTGAEEFSSDDDAETETETPSRRRTPRNSISGFQGRLRNFPFGYDAGAPVTLPPLQAKFPLRPSEEPAFLSSPPSIASSSVAGTPHQPFDGSDNESGRTVSPPPPVPFLPRAIMVDCSTMTDELPDTHTHAADLVALQAEHEKALKEISDEKALSYATALDELKSKHEEQLSKMQREVSLAHTHELETLKSSHTDEINKSIMEALRLSHADELAKTLANAQIIAETNAAHSRELEALKSSHVDEISKAMLKSSHADEIDIALADLPAKEAAEGQTTHAQEIDALKASFAIEASQKDLESRAAHDAKLEALKSSHLEQMMAREAEIMATHATELDNLKAKHADELKNMKLENDNRHAAEIAALLKNELFDAHSKQQLEKAKQHSDATHSEELASLTAAHLAQLEEVKNALVAAHGKELDLVEAAHMKHVEDLKNAADAQRGAEIASLVASHEKQIDSIRTETLKEVHAQEIDNLNSQHAATPIDKQIEALNAAHAESQSQALESLKASHERNIETLMKDVTSGHLRELNTKALEDLAATHSQQLENLRQGHLDQLAALNTQHESAKAKLEEELAGAHSEELASEIAALSDKHEAAESQKLQELTDAHSQLLENLKTEQLTHAHLHELENLRETTLAAAHADEMERLKEVHENHALELENLRNERDTATHAAELESLKYENEATHVQELEELKNDADVALTRELAALKADHASALELYQNDNAAEKEKLLADHAAELEALQISLQTKPPSLGFSTINSTETEPVEVSELRSPKRDAFIIPHEDRSAHTSSDTGLGLLGRRGERASTPEIAEDDTRQSPSATPVPETPESKTPFKELSANTNIRPSQKPGFSTSNQGCQTTLTSDGLDQLLKQQGYVSPDSFTITTSRGEVIVTPFDEAEARQRVGDSGFISATGPVAARQTDILASAQAPASPRLPLPPNHREAIEGARTHSSSGGKGPMGPPALPASAYNNSGSRPETPSSRRPLSPSSIVKGTPTPKAGRSSTPGYADVHSGPRMLLRSRQSSVSSFASEIDTRFNIRGEMGMDPSAFGPSTDPRMIQAITQTMIGEYLWKYTRKTGRGEMSENRHRRYFWVHPYTRTLYWSERDPSTGGRTELKAKSIPIEAVRIVGDDNPMPPGLHRKSLIIVSPGRTVKFTCTTGQRHETWFNALSYLLLRTGDESQADAEDVAGQITQEDVDEFNPSINRRPANGNRPRPPPSLSSYNSGATRSGSPRVEVSMSIPTLTPTREREASRSGTLGRLSGYWKSSSINSTFSSLRSKTHIPQEGAIYEASEVPDSAEDLRQIIEEQDRASDRLENVRACCDGEFNEVFLSNCMY
ncbi:hypothetical protein F4813DRAFT_380149 [Daldinia decipiens]|uniref:uncharacterized protein n=1 Tax=Daldinia decipiens TaxID=326647 RepID=UPI0020C50520|nr:uncharacterized protein F4813DRAFT_380149 [Daldinia decipiens]KAI1658612.1 hypothetical protein F4813DRAFT_380149 [Daldinia decipiens]